VPLNKLTVGEPFSKFPGNTFNTMVDICRRVQRDQPRFAADGARDILPDCFKWKNVSGSDAPMGAIIRFTDAVEADNVITLTGDKPDGTLRQLYGISLEPCEAGKLADATMFNPARAYYSTGDGTPAYGQSWGIEPSQWYLRKNRPGFFIFGDPHGSGTSARVLAVQSSHLEFIGALAGSLSQGSTATVNVYGGAGGSEAAISGLTVTARDWLMKSGASAIASGKKVIVRFINGIPYVVDAECD